MTRTGRRGIPVLDGAAAAMGGGPCCREVGDPVRLPLHERSSDEEPTSFNVGTFRDVKAMSKSIIGLLVSIAVLAILLTGCSDEPDPNPSNGTDSSTTTSSEQGVNPELTHAPTSAVTNTDASEAATPTPAALPTTTATPAATATAVAPKTRSAGGFISVSAGGFRTCGIRRDGFVACWGNDFVGQATPPSGEFAAVSAGEFHTCGVTQGDSMVCWGRQARGLTALPGG